MPLPQPSSKPGPAPVATRSPPKYIHPPLRSQKRAVPHNLVARAICSGPTGLICPFGLLGQQPASSAPPTVPFCSAAITVLGTVRVVLTGHRVPSFHLHLGRRPPLISLMDGSCLGENERPAHPQDRTHRLPLPRIVGSRLERRYPPTSPGTIPSLGT